MNVKKTLALFLALAMLLSMALTVSAEEWSVVCTGLGAVKSEALVLTTEPQSWSFISTTNETAVNNWDCAAIDVTSDAAWELTIRSDSFAVSEEFPWGTAGQDSFAPKAYPADWAAWLEQNHAGSPCVVTAQVVEGLEGNYIVVGFSNNGVTNVYKVPTNGSIGSVQLFLTGENCVLTKLQATDAHIDISAAVNSIPTASAPEWSVVCTTLGAVKSEALPLTTEVQSWRFICTTNETAVNNWDTAALDIISGAAWEATIRSDSYAVSEEFPWGTAGQDSFAPKAYPADWAAWLAQNHAGSECIVSAVVVDGLEGDYIIIGYSNGGVANVYKIPTVAALDSVQLYLTGENCVLTKLEAITEHIDLSAAIASVPTAAPEEPEVPTEPEEPEVPTEPEEPEVPTEPEEPEVPEEPWFVDSPTWWAGHSKPVVVTEEIQSWSFTSTSYPEAADNWDTATLVFFRSNDGAIHALGDEGYVEELVVRSDSWAVSEERGWDVGQPSWAPKAYPADWEAWLDANKAGAECIVTAQIVNGYLVVGYSNNGVVNVYAVPLNTDVDSPVYLSVTGEECSMTGWQSVNSHLDISAAVAAPADPTNPETGDFGILVVAFVCVMSFAALVVTGKKGFAR